MPLTGKNRNTRIKACFSVTL